jgi:hypothetical protein
MHRLRLRWVIPFALAAIGMCVIAPAASANTPNLANGCKSSTTPGGEMGHYPAWPGSQSYLRIACIFNHSTGGSGDFVSSTFTIHDFSNAVYHNGAARQITASGGGGTTITTADCRGMAAFVNRGITGTNVAARTFVTSVVGGCANGGTLNLNQALTGAPAGNYLVENSSVRAVTDASVDAAAPNITSATANFTAADTGVSVSATFIDDSACAVPATLTFVTATTANISACAVVTGVSPHLNQLVTIGATSDGGSVAPQGPITTTRTFNDASSPLANQVSSTASRFFASDVGMPISGGALVGCFITVRNSATLVTLAGTACTLAGVNNIVTVGLPTFTAPTSTDTVQNQGVQLPLNPGFVAGSRPCAEDNSAGFGIEGTWRNPGSFITGPFATQPAGTKAVGQIVFATAVISYAAYVLEIPGGLGIDPLIGGYHFNLVSPNVPTGLALCASTATSPGLGFSIGINATTASQAAIPSGQGRPSSAQLRSTRASNAGATSTVFITDDVNGAGVKWLAGTDTNFNRTCIIPATTPDINFVCGDG